MALVVVFSTLSFTIEKHYCGEHLVDVAINSEAKKCGMMDMSTLNNATKKSCCSDIVNIIKGQDELKSSIVNDFSADQQLFLAAFTFSYINLFEGLPQLVIPHKNYSPPDVIYDIQLLDGVFII